MKHRINKYKVIHGVMSPLEYTDYVLRDLIYERSKWGNGDVYWYSDYGSMIQNHSYDQLEKLYSIVQDYVEITCRNNHTYWFFRIQIEIIKLW